MMSIARLSEIREDNDITQSTMARIVGVHRNTYSLWEIGINIIPLNHLYAYCKYFHLRLDYVLSLDHNREEVEYPPFDLKEIGNTLKSLRKERHMTQEQLAKKLKVSQACIAKYEKGCILISTENLYQLSLIFHTSMTSICIGVKKKVTAL